MNDFFNNLFSLIFENPITSTDFEQLALQILGYLEKVAVSVCIIMFFWGAFVMLTATGDPEKIKTARKVLIYAAVGLAVILLASSMPSLIKDLLGLS